MLNYLKKEANMEFTENGAATYASTGSECLDLFATVGALRSATTKEIETRFMRAYAENRDMAMKLLFFARDVRGGLGERRVFRVILRYLAYNEPDSVRKNLTYIADYGRYDDLLELLDTPCEEDMLNVLKAQFETDNEALKEGKPVSLLAKWLPSVNASNFCTVRNAKRIARYFGISEACYRKALVALRAQIKIIENNLREKDYTFDYSKQPSKAMYKYRKAFIRNDNERYAEFLDRVKVGTAKLHTGTLMPYEIISPIFKNIFYLTPLSAEERTAINTTWMAQEDFTDNENAIVVVDGSGSMYGFIEPKPIAVALSLGMYFAERNTGAFKNHFITFSETPKLVEIKGRDIFEKVKYCASFNEVANTNIRRVFELILETAKKNALPQEELPGKIYIVSDMEFDQCSVENDTPCFEYVKMLFEDAGYTLPKVVFWNVASRNVHQPVTVNDTGVALVSGFTPRLFSMVAKGNLDPYAFMLDVLNSERYARIVA